MDELDEALLGIQADKLEARLSLSLDEKIRLVEKWGPKRISDLVKAKSQIPIQRIPFIFNTIDTQDVLDVLANDMEDAIEAVLAR